MPDLMNANPDDELAAMRAIADTFVALTDDERCRVIRWAADRYDVTVNLRVSSHD